MGWFYFFKTLPISLPFTNSLMRYVLVRNKKNPAVLPGLSFVLFLFTGLLDRFKVSLFHTRFARCTASGAGPLVGVHVQIPVEQVSLPVSEIHSVPFFVMATSMREPAIKMRP